MLFLVGLGLCDGSDITVRGKSIVSRASAVFLEGYTSLLQCSHKELEEQLGVSITLLSRDDVEKKIEPILESAHDEDVVILIIGDPFGATTHADLVLRAYNMDVPVHVVHNASILSAVGEIGLELYRFGKTVSIPYWEQGFEPTSFADGIQDNMSLGLHTLCLLDIKSDEERFMSVSEGLALLKKAGFIPELAVGVARLGCSDQVVAIGSPDDISSVDFGIPPHCLLIPGKLHPIEEEMLKRYH